MAQTEQPYTRVAKAVVGDVQRTRESAAQQLIPGGGPGAETTTRAAMIQHVRDAWPYPEIRQQLFTRFVPAVQGPDGQSYPARNGLKNWEDLVKAAFPNGYPEPAPMMGEGFAPQPGFDPGAA